LLGVESERTVTRSTASGSVAASRPQPGIQRASVSIDCASSPSPAPVPPPAAGPAAFSSTTAFHPAPAAACAQARPATLPPTTTATLSPISEVFASPNSASHLLLSVHGT
jgi:hypothetical protein